MQQLQTLFAAGCFYNVKPILQHFEENLPVDLGIIHNENKLSAAVPFQPFSDLLTDFLRTAFCHNLISMLLCLIHQPIRTLQGSPHSFFYRRYSSDAYRKGDTRIALQSGLTKLFLDLVELFVKGVLPDSGQYQQKFVPAVADQKICFSDMG